MFSSRPPSSYACQIPRDGVEQLLNTSGNGHDWFLYAPNRSLMAICQRFISTEIPGRPMDTDSLWVHDSLVPNLAGPRERGYERENWTERWKLRDACSHGWLRFQASRCLGLSDLTF